MFHRPPLLVFISLSVLQAVLAACPDGTTLVFDEYSASSGKPFKDLFQWTYVEGKADQMTTDKDTGGMNFEVSENGDGNQNALVHNGARYKPTSSNPLTVSVMQKPNGGAVDATVSYWSGATNGDDIVFFQKGLAAPSSNPGFLLQFVSGGKQVKQDEISIKPTDNIDSVQDNPFLFAFKTDGDGPGLPPDPYNFTSRVTDTSYNLVHQGKTDFITVSRGNSFPGQGPDGVYVVIGGRKTGDKAANDFTRGTYKSMVTYLGIQGCRVQPPPKQPDPPAQTSSSVAQVAAVVSSAATSSSPPQVTSSAPQAAAIPSLPPVTSQLPVSLNPPPTLSSNIQSSSTAIADPVVLTSISNRTAESMSTKSANVNVKGKVLTVTSVMPETTVSPGSTDQLGSGESVKLAWLTIVFCLHISVQFML